MRYSLPHAGGVYGGAVALARGSDTNNFIFVQGSGGEPDGRGHQTASPPRYLATFLSPFAQDSWGPASTLVQTPVLARCHLIRAFTLQEPLSQR